MYLLIGISEQLENSNLLDSDLDAGTQLRHTWSPGALKYYGRAELQASDHR